jgi:hypothetical protein
MPTAPRKTRLVNVLWAGALAVLILGVGYVLSYPAVVKWTGRADQRLYAPCMSLYYAPGCGLLLDWASVWGQDVEDAIFEAWASSLFEEI